MGRIFWLIALLTPFAVPLLVFLVAGLSVGMSPPDAFTALVEQCAQRKQNPLVTGILGLAPIGVLALVLLGVRRRSPGGVAAAAWGGLAGAAIVIAWANWEYWPKFLPERTFMMFPHGLELVIGPLFFAPVAVVVGAIAGWLAGKSSA